MAPNAARVLRRIGVIDRLLDLAYHPSFRRSRQWDTGEVTNETAYGQRVVEKYGEPYLYLHRGDLHAALVSAVPEEIVHMGRRLVEVREREDAVDLSFADGSKASADILIAADGVHSPVRESLFGDTDATFTGRVAYRAVFPIELVGDLPLDPSCKWWGADRHIVIYPVAAGRELYFTTSTPDTWDVESWSAEGDVEELRRAYAGFHPHVQAVLAACPTVHKWAIYERPPLAAWHTDRVTLLGDACHPMTPYMAQGAAMALEDAAVLVRSLEDAPDARTAFTTYVHTRKGRTAQMQAMSSSNTWLRYPMSPDWVWSYDATTVPLSADADPLPSGSPAWKTR